MMQDVYFALMYHLETLVFSPAISVAWPDSDFTPPDPDPTTAAKWLRPSFLPGDSFAINLSGQRSQNPGLFQIDLFMAKNQGELTARNVTDLICEHFRRDQKLREGSATVHIIDPPVTFPVRNETDWNVYSVRVPYVVF